MVRVIFSTGKEVKYENADQWEHYQPFHGQPFIKIMQNGRWVASAPADCAIDFNSGTSANAQDIDKAAKFVIRNIKSVSKWDMAELKRLAMKYQIKTHKFSR